MIQEYIPGGRFNNFAITLDKKGELKMVFCRKVLTILVGFAKFLLWIRRSRSPMPSMLQGWFRNSAGGEASRFKHLLIRGITPQS